MPEPFDVYSDQFQVVLNPWGASLNFQLTPAQPPAPGQPTPADLLGTTRMSMEHLKALVFISRRQIMQVERAAGVSYPLPMEVLNQMGISPEDWETFWRS